MEAVKPRKKHRKKNKNAATESIKTEEDSKTIQGDSLETETKEEQLHEEQDVAASNVAAKHEEDNKNVDETETEESSNFTFGLDSAEANEGTERDTDLSKEQCIESKDTEIPSTNEGNEITLQTEEVNSEIQSFTTDINELKEELPSNGKENTELGNEWKGLPAPVKQDGNEETEHNEIAVPKHEEKAESKNVEEICEEQNVAVKTQTPTETIIRDENKIEEEVKGLEKEKEQKEREQERNREIKTIYPKQESASHKEKVKKSIKEQILLEPFTEDQLKIFYFNPLLEQLQGFTDRFLVIAKQDKHEFYELVNTYYRSRNAVSVAVEEFKIVEKECDGKKEHFWINKDLTVSAQGKCRDNVTVTHTEHYQQVELNSSVVAEITNLLKTLRKALHETLCLQMYTCQTAQLRVNLYLYEMINHSPILSKVFSEALVGGQSPQEITSEFQADVQKLRDCISVLFMFVRQPLQDQEFADHLHAWMKHLVSILLRVATLADLVFLVNHVMRCPPGFASKVASFIQFPVPHFHGDINVVGEQYLWDNPLVHHFVAMLAAILLPVRGREEFLQRMMTRRNGTMRSISWTLIDEDGEEDENPENSWMLFQEGDLVAVFGQFPFDAFFKHLFRMDPYLDGNYMSEGLYCIEKTSSRDIMRMLAFASCIVNIMGAAFGTYQNVRYRGFVKRVGRTIRQVVQYVLDHWSNYRSWRMDMCRETYTSIPDMYSLEEQFSLQRLQTEVDQFFMKATQQIICAHNLGAWQFLAGMPFKSVSSPTLWTLFWALHTDLRQMIPVLTTNGQQCTGEHEWQTRLQELRSEFTDQLSHMSQSEAVFLLTTFANMATSRESHEKDFIEAITLEVFEVSFISDQTREFCSKTGRDLLGTIAGFHPFIFTVLLHRVAESIQTIGKAGVYMFNGLPIHLCHPTSADMDVLRGWLLKAELSSPEHQLARHILQNMNWGCAGDQGESDHLFLDRSWHRAVAVMLVEASALRLPNRPGGISHDAFKEGGGLLQQVTLIAASSYSRLMQQNHEQVFADWLWDMMLLLRLHEYDLPTPVMGFRNRSQAIQRRGTEGDTGFAGRTKALSSPEPPDLYTDKTLVNVVNAIKASGSLACYVATAMTIIGSNTDIFISDGLDHLTIILNEKCFDAVLRIIYNIIPMFFSCPDKLVEENRFTKILHRLCQLDGESAYYAEKLLLYPTAGEYSGRLSGIIQSHIDKSHLNRNSPGPLSVVELWMKALCSLPNWYKDGCIQYLLDGLMKAAFKIEGGLAATKDKLIDAYKTVLKETGNQGLFASILSLVSLSSAGPPLLWDIKSSPDYSYYAFSVLSMEDQMEENSGLRVELAKILLENQDINIDYALKKVTKVMKLSSTPQTSHLSIYRWANQSLNTAMDHPLLPLIWQRFFRLYLSRPSSHPSMPQRASVGYRFFESQADVSLQKRMKQRLQTTAEHHRSMTSQTRVDQDSVGEGDQEIDKQFEETKAFHEKLALFFEVLALWLDEPRLHDPNLYLPSLPPLYDPQRLELVLKVNQEPWLDLIHVRKIEWELTETVGKWMKYIYGSQNKKTSILSRQSSSSPPDTATGRIIKRMRTHQPPLTPPPVVMMESPLPPFDDKFLTNKQKVTSKVFECLQKLLAHAKQFCRDADHHVALDQNYVDLIPRFATNQMTRLVKKVPCRSKFKASDVCSGPATITLQFMSRYDNQVVGNRIHENREEYDKMVKNFFQPCPMDVCSAAGYVERIIACLVKKAQVTQERSIKELLTDIGTSLFYQLAGAMNETCIRFQPTIQFFSSCVEILGKEFILNNGSQTEQLLAAILEHTSITMLLVPYFCPIDNPEKFTAMYHDVMQITDRDLAFSLLTKFDLEKWLSSPNSSFIERSGLTAVVFTALKSLGLEPDPEAKAISEVYLRHMSLVLMYNFPEQYSETLQNLCEGSNSRSLSLDVWERFLFCIGCVPVQGGGQPLQTPAHAPELADEQVVETLDWLTKYFTNQRAELGGHVTGGLYTLWRPYIKQLSFLLGFMCQQIVVRSARRMTDSTGEMERYWKLICKAFEPWICSQDSPVQGNPPVAPWNETEVPQASDMVALFTDTISCLNTHFPSDCSGSSMMNLFWSFFVTSLVKPGIPDYVRRVYHSKFFCLPWNQFYPTPSNIDLMLELFHHDQPTADALAVDGSTTSLNLHMACKTSFQFLGCVFPLIDWSNVVTAYCESQTPETLARFLTSLFHLLIMLTNEKSIVEVQGSELPTFLEKAHFFPWEHIEARSFDQIVSWQVDHCNAELILQRNSTIWHAVRLIRAASGIIVTESGTMQETKPDAVPKRANYISSIVKLLVKCSSNPNLAPDLYPPVIMFIVTDIESIAGSGVDPSSTESEVCLLLSETLNLLNNCSPVNHLTSHVLNYILSYLRSTTSLMFILASIPASCRALANIGFMVSVLETGIEEVFARHSPQTEGTGTHSAVGWDQIVPGFSVPELSQDSFINECLHQSSMLTLYLYVLLRLSQCQSAVQEMSVLTDIVSWCGRLKIKKENEYKITLFWHKILQLCMRQADFSGSPLHEVAKQLSFLATNLHQLGEDKDSSGLLGAIGFGKKSSYSVNFRFFARALEAFILAQLPSNTLLRLEAKAPGYVREPTRSKQHNESGRTISSTNEAELALATLENLRHNKQYSMLSGQIMDMYAFIANPLHSLRDGPVMISKLAVDLYPGRYALLIMN